MIDEEKNDIMRAGLLSKAVEHITLLVEEWFTGVRPRFVLLCLVSFSVFLNLSSILCVLCPSPTLLSLPPCDPLPLCVPVPSL